MQAPDPQIVLASRQHRCLYCPKSFKRSEHRIRHQRTHTREKPFSCRFCRTAYSRKDLVTRHERSKHPGEVVDAEPTSLRLVGNKSAPVITLGTPDRGNGHAWCQLEVAPVPFRRASPGPVPPSRVAAEGQLEAFGASAARDQPEVSQGLRGSHHMILNEQHQEAGGSPRDQLSANPTDPAAYPPDLTFGGGLVPLLDVSFDLLDDFEASELPGWMQSEARPPAASDTGSPGALGPGPSMTEISAGVDGTSSLGPPPQLSTGLPHLLAEKRTSAPQLLLDQVGYDHLTRELSDRLESTERMRDVPSAQTCEMFLTSYVKNFHRHLPFIHLESMVVRKTPGPLVLAMCSIGALYRLDRRRSQHLYDLAWSSIRLILASCQAVAATSPQDYPLWLAQTKLLLTFYATMSGCKDLFATAIGENGFYSLMYSRVRQSLCGRGDHPGDPSWHKWIERESWKRLLGGIYVVSTLSMIIFNINPGFNATHDLDFEAFHRESLWNAATEDNWRNLHARYSADRLMLVKDVFLDVTVGGESVSTSELYHISPFSALITMHCVVVHIWHLLQASQAFSRNDSAVPLGFPSLRFSLIKTALRSLDRCQQILTNCQHEHNDSFDDDDCDDISSKSLIFNCQAILRSAYIRLFDRTCSFDKLSVVAPDPRSIDIAVSTFADLKINRSSYLMKAVEESFEGFRIPVTMGHMLMRKTAALRWSVEQAAAGWDCALFVAAWVHSVEMDALNGKQPSQGEATVLTLVRRTLVEADCDVDSTRSLAASLARGWSMLLQDVWVWGITPCMGAVLDKLAVAYERHHETSIS